MSGENTSGPGFIRMALMGIGALVVLGSCGFCGLLAVGMMSSSSTSDSDAPAPYEAGRSFRVAEIDYSIVGENRGPSIASSSEFLGDLQTDDGGDWYVVTVTAKNLDDMARAVDDIELSDSQGRRFRATHYVGGRDVYGLPDSCTLASMNPGLETTCAVLFEVPSGAEDFTATVDALFDEARVSLEP